MKKAVCRFSAHRKGLFCTQCHHGVLFGSHGGGEQTGDHGQSDAQRDEQIAIPRQYRGQGGNAGQGTGDPADGEAEQDGRNNAYHTGKEADDHGFCIEYAGNVLL